MKLPNADLAYVPTEKLTLYLLSESHPVGKAKARFFIGCGYSAERLEEFAAALLGIAHAEEVLDSQATPFGIKYVVGGRVRTPNGTEITLRTVWQIDDDDSRPRSYRPILDKIRRIFECFTNSIRSS